MGAGRTAWSRWGTVDSHTPGRGWPVRLVLARGLCSLVGGALGRFLPAGYADRGRRGSAPSRERQAVPRLPAVPEVGTPAGPPPSPAASWQPCPHSSRGQSRTGLLLWPGRPCWTPACPSGRASRRPVVLSSLPVIIYSETWWTSVRRGLKIPTIARTPAAWPAARPAAWPVVRPAVRPAVCVASGAEWPL